MFSELNSIKLKNNYLAFRNPLNERLQFLQDNNTQTPPVPIMPYGLAYHSVNFLRITYEVGCFIPSSSCAHHMLRWFPGLKFTSLILNPMCFTPSFVQNDQGFKVEVLTDFLLTKPHYQSHDTPFNASSTNCTGVLCNSSNVHVLRDKILFVGDIEPCPQELML